MNALVGLLLAFAVVQAQDVALPRSKPSKSQAYYAPYPNWVKPSSPFKVFPPSYHPSQICFNPNYYGLFGAGDISRTSPIPLPNVYYNLPVAPTAQYPMAWPTWNAYPCYPQVPSPLPPKPLGSVHHVPGNNVIHSTLGISQHNNTLPKSTTAKPPIKVTRPTITVHITPPKFNENGTTITNAFKPPNVHSQEPTNKLDEKTRTMIKHFLEMGSKHKPTRSDEANKNRGDIDPEFVIGDRSRRGNVYPLPAVVYGNSDEPTTRYDRLRTFTQIPPPPTCDRFEV